MNGLVLVLMCGAFSPGAAQATERAPAAQALENAAASDDLSGPNLSGLDLAFRGPSELVRIRLRLACGGVPLARRRQAALAALFRHADRSADGSLDRLEVTRLPTGLSVRQILWGNLAPASTDGPPWETLDVDGSDTVSQAELATYYEREGLGIALVSTSSFTGSQALNRALKQAVDSNQDGQFAETEWASLASSLAKLDTNDDQLVQAEELVVGIDYPGVALGRLLRPEFAKDSKPAANWPLVVVPAAGEDRLTSAVLAAWRTSTPQAEVTLDLDRAGEPAEPPPAFESQRMTIHFGPTFQPADETLSTACKQLLDDFAAADADVNHKIDSNDAAAAGQLARVFVPADENGDDRLERAELTRWLQLQKLLADSLAVVTIVDAGAGLFQELDHNRDGALSVREIRDARPRLLRSRALVNEQLDEQKFRQNVQVAASLGRPGRISFALPRRGPAWHQGMDRNGDGDISRREFLGSEASFDKLDADRDGLLDANEARVAAP
jgi:hypothetical protein